MQTEQNAAPKPVKTLRSKLKMNAEQKREAKRLIGTVTKSEVRSHFTTDFGRQHDASGVSVIVPEKKAKGLVETLRAMLTREMLAFFGTHQWLRRDVQRGQVVVGVRVSQFDILRLARSNGANYNISTEEIIDKLMEYDREVGIRIWHAETDVVEFDLLHTPDDMVAFTADVYAFCPDIIDQGDMDVQEMAEAIAAAGTVYLWWD